MGYFDFERFESIDPVEFQSQKPYPWVNPEGLMTPQGFADLRTNLPALSLFERRFGEARKAGQYPHDRYSLEYTLESPVPRQWHEFIAELRSDRYRVHLCRLLGAPKVEFRFHWHVTPSGCSVSPHCDADREWGSHLFYLNDADDWDPAWGGQTLILDDRGRLEPKSAPGFEEFEVLSAESMGNRSLLFANQGHSWHGVSPIECPDDRMRKIFIIVINQRSLRWRVRDALKRKQITRY